MKLNVKCQSSKLKRSSKPKFPKLLLLGFGFDLLFGFWIFLPTASEKEPELR